MHFSTLLALALSPFVLGVDLQPPEDIPISAANALFTQDLPALVKATADILIKTPPPLTTVAANSDNEKLRITFSDYNKLSYCPNHDPADVKLFPEGTTTPTPIWSKVVYIETKQPLGYHVVAVDDVRKSIVVVFRGSMNLSVRANLFMAELHSVGVFTKKWRDMTSANNALAKHGFQARVHRGCWQGYNTVRNDLLKRVGELLQSNPGYSVSVTGYSYGGPLAVYAATDFRLQYATTNVNVVTFGGPRPGDRTYAELVRQLFTDGGNKNVYQRVTAFRDPYPLFPPPTLGYVHGGQEHFRQKGGEHVLCATAPGAKDAAIEDPRCDMSILQENPIVKGDGLAKESVHHTYWKYMECGPGEAYEEGAMVKVDLKQKVELEKQVFADFARTLNVGDKVRVPGFTGKTPKGNNEV